MRASLTSLSSASRILLVGQGSLCPRAVTLRNPGFSGIWKDETQRQEGQDLGLFGYKSHKGTLWSSLDTPFAFVFPRLGPIFQGLPLPSAIAPRPT